jgi:hypothetical protein
MIKKKGDGFELSVDSIFSILYTPYNIRNDTGLPCESVPITDELISYVEYRGPEVLGLDDLPLIGNCSRWSYCDVKTRTCQPKREYHSPCKHNMQCYYGDDGIPGLCTNHTTCDVRQDILAYYQPQQRWTLGDDWRQSIVAVLITGGVVLLVILGRIQIAKLFTNIKNMLERWQNAETPRPAPILETEEGWGGNQSGWWSQVPGIKWVYTKWKRTDQDQYYQLNNRSEEPPAYRE